jgi:hypothetical protein
MLMYLEISRPKGQAARFEKVFERLTLLNTAFPFKRACSIESKLVGKQYVPLSIREIVLRYIIQHGRILLGAEVAAIYNLASRHSKFRPPSIDWFLKNRSFILFYSPDVKIDADALETLGLERKSYPASGDILGRRIVLSYKGVPIVGLIEENACHSYNTLNLKAEGKLLIGSLDTLIMVYLWFSIFASKEEYEYLGYPILCLCQKLVEMDVILRKRDAKGKGPFPAFSLQCSGYQKGFATLLREKARRIQKEKNKLKTRKSMKTSNKTRRLRN